MANIEPGYKTDKLGCFDLTQCNTYRLVDKDGTERFVLTYPKKWEAQEPMEGSTKIPYLVTEWGEMEIDVKPYEGT